MSLTPTKKLIRELKRVGSQINAVILPLRLLLVRLYWGTCRPVLLCPHAGTRPKTNSIAVFLVYQPNGLADSTLETLDLVSQLGFAPLVICNGHMPPSDVERLKTKAWTVLLRPNIGYDFGGYRDGIWFLNRNRIIPERLLVLNDTVWMPAQTDGVPGSSLEKMLQLPGPYQAMSNFVYRPKSGRNDDLVRKTYPSSFCFCVTQEIWLSDAFQQFWRRLPLHNEKHRVVQSGEVGFGRAITGAGFALTTLIDHAEIRKSVSAMPPQEQALFLRNLPVVNKHWREELDAMVSAIASGQSEDNDLTGFLDRLLPELNPWDSLVVNGLVSRQTDFIKKANLKIPANALRFLRMVDDAGIQLRPSVRSEIEALARPKDMTPH